MTKARGKESEWEGKAWEEGGWEGAEGVWAGRAALPFGNVLRRDTAGGPPSIGGGGRRKKLLGGGCPRDTERAALLVKSPSLFSFSLSFDNNSLCIFRRVKRAHEIELAATSTGRLHTGPANRVRCLCI
jgi:hypothetical protein